MLTKEKLKATLDKFPDEFSIEELIEKLIFLDKIERGDQQSQKGEVIEEEQLDKEMKNGSDKLDLTRRRRPEKYAKIQVVKIRSRTKVLLTNPEIGRVVPEIDKKDIRELFEGNYRIVYKLINKSRIDILTIHHQSIDFKKVTFKRLPTPGMPHSGFVGG